MYKLRDTLANELDKIAEKENLTHSELDLVHTLSDTIKNLDKIEAMEENGYSYGGGMWTAEGNYDSRRRSGTYNDGMSNRRSMRRGRSYARDIDSMMEDPRYSEEDRRSLARARDLMGNY